MTSHTDGKPLKKVIDAFLYVAQSDLKNHHKTGNKATRNILSQKVFKPKWVTKLPKQNTEFV